MRICRLHIFLRFQHFLADNVDVSSLVFHFQSHIIDQSVDSLGILLCFRDGFASLLRYISLKFQLTLQFLFLPQYGTPFWVILSRVLFIVTQIIPAIFPVLLSRPGIQEGFLKKVVHYCLVATGLLFVLLFCVFEFIAMVGFLEFQLHFLNDIFGLGQLAVD